MAMRTETDALGEVQCPADKYWGAQTQRSLQHFPINLPTDTMPSALIAAFGHLKASAAVVNAANGVMEPELAKAIEQAASEVASLKLIDHFPLSIWQTGSGTQTNMNTNEVVSNRANEILGVKERGTKKPVHPNDHVNRSGSSNDGTATAMHIAAVCEIEGRLLPSLESLWQAMSKKSEEFEKLGLVKVGRTHLQDAVPLSLGQEFSGFAAQLELGKERIFDGLKGLRYLAMGGTAVGTGLNVFKGFDEQFCKEVSRRTGCQFQVAKNKFEAISANDAIVFASGALNTLAASLFKIAQDIRFEGSGPRCGFGELLLPPNEPGSSYMPGKVNPTQCEAMTMICAKVIGNHTSISIGGLSGQFQLNCFKPLLISSLLQSVRILSDGMDSFRKYCIDGLKANEKRIKELSDKK